MNRKNIPQRRWTAAEDAVLCRLYDTLPASEIGLQLGRSKASVQNRIATLGIAKGHNSGRFAKGQTPWNTGAPFVAGGRSADTRFKPGRPPELARNYAPIGTERVSKDGYLERKISDDLRLAPARRWRAVHILIWEATHGPLPSGHAIAFRDSNKRNLAEDNLELVSRADLMRRNSFHRYGKEIAALVQLRATITRQINRKTQEATP
jgi:hypothetical protein